MNDVRGALAALRSEGASDVPPIPVVEADHIVVRHPRRGGRGGHLTAVDGVSLSVRPGEIVGIVGESGSGKTSLAMAITSLGRLSGGTVRLLGTDTGTLRPRALRRARADVQVVFQDPHGSLDPRQSVRAGLAELRALQPERSSWITDEELMERVKLDPALLSRFPHQLSGGQAQRVCIARALLLRPRVLVADEPTSGLDVSVQADVLRLLLELRETTGIAILLVSHDLSVVRQLCDRIYVMLEGRIVEEGPPGEVFDAPEHEYTRRLVDAIPGRGGLARARERIAAAELSTEAPPPSRPLPERLAAVGRFLGAKTLIALTTLVLALTLAFALGRLSGDPVVSILGPFATQEQIATLRAELGLDQSLLEQYATYMADTLRGDLGTSLQYFTANTELIRSRLGASVELMVAGLLLAVLVGLPLGVVAALKEGTAWDRLASGLALVGQSVPIFWLGLVLVLLFAIRWGILPAGQQGDLSHLVLPAVTLSLYPAAHIARLTRASMAEVLHEPYIDAARARGLSSLRIVGRHALRNASPPILTVTALQAGVLLSGAVAVEYVFSWPGLGLLAIDAVNFRDTTLVQAIVVVGAITFVAVNLAVDLLYGVIDPRIRDAR